MFFCFISTFGVLWFSLGRIGLARCNCGLFVFFIAEYIRFRCDVTRLRIYKGRVSAIAIFRCSHSFHLNIITQYRVYVFLSNMESLFSHSLSHLCATNKLEYHMFCHNKHGYFDVFQIVAGSFISESFPLFLFVF